MRSRLDTGASFGITMVACIFEELRRRRHALRVIAGGKRDHAAAARLSCGIEESLLNAPRNLKEPVRCSDFRFQENLAPTRSFSTGTDNNGVRTA